MILTLNAASGYQFEQSDFRSLTGLDSSQGAGVFYLQSGSPNGLIITRGGNFSAGNSPGIFGGDIDTTESTTGGSMGFRCLYTR